MELIFNNINLKNKNKYLIKNLNLTIEDKEITGIIKDKENIIKKILVDKCDFEGELNIDDRVISYVNNRNFLTKTVSDEFYLVKNNLKEKDNFIEKLLSSINMVGLTDDYLERNINTLSKTEKILVEIALSLITNPDILILDNIFNNLDKSNKLVIKKILLELKKNYNKIIIIIDDINIIYEICNNIIIFKDNYLLISGNKKEVFNDIDLLIDNEIELPFFIEFSYNAKNYNKEIKYYQEINDLIKGVYKNAR